MSDYIEFPDVVLNLLHIKWPKIFLQRKNSSNCHQYGIWLIAVIQHAQLPVKFSKKIGLPNNQN